MILIHCTHLPAALSIIRSGFSGSEHKALGAEPGANFFGLDQLVPFDEIQHLPQQCYMFFRWYGGVMKSKINSGIGDPQNDIVYDFGPERKHIYGHDGQNLRFMFAKLNLSSDEYHQKVVNPFDSGKVNISGVDCVQKFEKHRNEKVAVLR